MTRTGGRSASVVDRLKTWALLPLPQHALSRVVLWLTRRESRFTPAAIRWFARSFNVDMHDAVEPSLDAYTTFNAFFTRALKSAARPVARERDAIASAADGRISAIGQVRDARVFQAKGLDYSLLDLLGSDTDAARCLANGSFATLYLSPRDYHRLHMPLTGKLLSQTHVPGRLHSVGMHTVRALPGLFTRNERVIAQFDTERGRMALVLVGAINVAAIETVWHGLITPPQRSSVQRIDYHGDQQITLEQGQEIGRFNMGSTIIILLENPAAWRQDMQVDDPVLMGQFLGNCIRQTPQ